MGILSELSLKRTYTTGINDVINDFYNPVLAVSSKYDRSVGYFTSSALIAYLTGLSHFVEAGGQMRLLISPILAKDDQQVLEQLQSACYETQLEDMFKQFRTGSELEFTSAQLLFALVKEGYLTIKVVYPLNEFGLFHQKIGLFHDFVDNTIAINGSNNETAAALNLNFENFSVFCNWKVDGKGYVDEYQSNFEREWSGDVGSNFTVLPIEDALEDSVIKQFDSDKNVGQLFKQFNQIQANGNNAGFENDIAKIEELKFKPFEYQTRAFETWKNKKRGIFAFATGTGKTKTALICINWYLNQPNNNSTIVVVPDKTLNQQWAKECQEYDWEVVQCYSDNPRWKINLKDALKLQQVSSKKTLVIVTQDTFLTDRFEQMLSRFKNNYLFVCDECHHATTDRMLAALPQVDYRLGLSATPEIYNDKDKTKRLFEYFGGIVAAYALDKAIEDGKLTPYEYHPIVIGFTTDEAEKYRKITAKVVKLKAVIDQHGRSNELEQQIQMALFQRARIVYNASEKLRELKKILKIDSVLDHLLVYCGATGGAAHDGSQSTTQLSQVNRVLGELNVGYAQYTQAENGEERLDRIEDFKSGSLKVLSAVKCLDEGVDIPEIKSAIIMASSNNPREFIQRRGRLLRRFRGKDKVIIYDFLVDEPEFTFLCHNEYARLKEFSSCALNEDDLKTRFGSRMEQYIDEEQNSNG